MLLTSGLCGCTFMTGKEMLERSSLVVDDGISEITPVYIMTRNESQSSTFVRANYYFYDDQRRVELIPGASIKVNGIELQRDPKALVSYIGNIPLPHELLTFEFERAPGQIIRHSFALPDLDVVEFPKTYRVGENLTIAVNHRPPRPGVERDSYGLELRRSDGGFYDFAIEEAGSPRMVFKPLLEIGFPRGFYTAHLFRQQRTPLKNLSSDLQTGWAVASMSRDFAIEVIN
jgi:hypothetical protein